MLKQLVGSNTNIKKLYLLNVSGAETKCYSKLSDKVDSLASFDKLEQTKSRSLILVEDIINMSKGDEQLLRKSLNYDAHHKSQKIFCVSHSIYKTCIWSLLSFFHFIIFTSAPSNTPVLRFTLNYFKIEKTQLDLWLEKFKELGLGGQKGLYFYFDCLKMTFNLSENTSFTKLRVLGVAGTTENQTESKIASPGVANSEQKQKLQQKFDHLVEAFESKTQASAVFSILINSLAVNLIREKDLSFAFKSSRNRVHREIRFSLVDYVTTLLTPLIPVSQPLRVFHVYVKSLCHVPQIFCLNKCFKN